MKLFYRPKTSGRPMRVAWALEELAVEYEAIPVDTDDPAFTDISPLGRVPVLEFDDGERLADSTAILFALGDRYPQASLLAPPGDPHRDLAYQWSLMAMTELEKAAIEHLHDQDDASRDAFKAAAAVFGAAVENRDYLVGSTLTVADIVTVGVLFICERSDFVSQQAPPALQAYFERLGSRPALVRGAERVESIFTPSV